MNSQSVIANEGLGSTSVIIGGGEMGERIRAFNWQDNSLGPILGWSHSLRTAVNIVLQSPVPLVMLWGPDGIMLYNDAYSEFAGARHPFLLGSKVLEGWSEVADFNRRVMECCLNGETLSFKDQQLTLYRNNVPEEVWMDLNYSPIMDENGKPAGVLAIVVETSRRVLAEQALQQSEERLRLVIEGSNDGIWDWDYRNDKAWWNDRYSEILGVEIPEEDRSLSSILPYMHPEDRDIIPQALKDHLEKGKKFEFEFRFLRESGEIRYVYVKGKALLDDGNVIRMAGTLTDQTERKQVEIAFQQSEAKLRRVIESGIMGFVFWNKNGEIVDANDAFLKMTGYTQEELEAGRINWQAMTPPEYQHLDEKAFEEMAVSGRCLPYEKQYIGKNGQRIDILLAVAYYNESQDEGVAYILDITNRKKVEAALIESERRFRVMADASPHFIWELSSTGEPKYVNKAALHYVGKTFEEYVSHPWSCYLHADDMEFVTNTIMDAVAKRQGYRLEHRIKGADGSYRWFISSADPSFLPDGEVYRYIGSAIDIHDRKLAEEALKESEERFRIMAEASSVMIWMLTTDGQIVYLNKRILEFLGTTLEKAKEANWTPYFKPEDVQVVSSKLEAAILEKQEYHLEVKMWHAPTQDYRWILTSGAPIFKADGEMIGFIGTAVDIHDRKNFESALQQIVQQQKAVTALGLKALSKADPLDLINQACKILGQALNVPYTKVLETLDNQEAFLLRAAYGFEQAQVGRVVSVADEPQAGYTLKYQVPVVVDNIYTETRFNASETHYQYKLVSGISVIINGRMGAPYGILQADCKEPQSFSNDDVNFLQAIANVLALAIEQKQIEEEREQAKIEAEEANKKKSEFLTMMSHELRTPLNAILGYSRMLELGMVGEVNEKQSKYLHNVGKSGQHLLTLINDLLDVSKIEAGKMDLMLEWIHVDDVVNDIYSMMSELANSKNVRLEFYVSPEINRIYVDPARFKQILVNLVNNAIKFNTKNGNVLVRIYPKHPWIIIVVKDTGIGIPKDKQSQLFSKFYQVDNSGTRRHEGTGLGLALTRSLIELHHGTIEVESEEGIGTAFTIKIPLSLQPE